ncbi:DoxX-like family protein [Massilia sp. H-1]|nr:DoxX-like family protein [Massilia sp. H-1]
MFIAWKLPEFLAHPYGPLTKNLPMLAAIWLLAEFEEA